MFISVYVFHQEKIKLNSNFNENDKELIKNCCKLLEYLFLLETGFDFCSSCIRDLETEKSYLDIFDGTSPDRILCYAKSLGRSAGETIVNISDYIDIIREGKENPIMKYIFDNRKKYENNHISNYRDHQENGNKLKYD